MNAQDLMNALNNLLDLGDTLDNAGGGVRALSDGAHTTREVCKLQLGQFLLYVADGGPSINDGQAAVLNLVFHEGLGDTSPEQYMELAGSIDAPDPDKNLTLIAFQQGDMALSAQNGTASTSLTDILINTYEAFGQLMIAMNESVVARSRYDRIMAGLKSKVSSSGSGIADYDSDFEIADDVLVKYNGSDNDVVIPSGITRIGESAFSHNDDLEHVTIPEGITEIEEDAFSWCKSLKAISLPSTITTVGSDAFCFCNDIKQIRIPATLTDIGHDAFMYCSGLETVVVFGGKRTNAALEKMKEHFPENVDVQWEGEEQKVSKGLQTSKKSNTTSGKKASSSGNSGKTSPGKSKKAATGSKKNAPAEEGNSISYTFKPRVILCLPGDEFSIKEIDEGLHEGEVEIASTKYNNENDSKIEFHCKVDEPWGSESDVFGRIEGWFSSVYSFTERYQTTPKSHVMINTSMLRLNIAISKDEVLRIEADWLFGESKFKDAASQLMAIWNGLMINGRKVSFGSHSIDWYADRWVEVHKEENRKSNEEAERKHNQSIERGKEKAKAHTAEYNDRLSFVLPDGTDLIKKEKDDGTELREIAMHVLVDDDGDVSYETLIVLFDLFNQDGESNVDNSKISVESILQAAPGCRHYKLCDSPDTTLVVSDSMITFIGKDVKIVNLDVFVSYAPNHIFQMHYAEALDKIRNNKAENIQLMINAIRMMRIDGKALDVISVNNEELGQQLILDDFEAESSGTVGLKIVVNGKEIENDENSESDDEDDSSPMSSPKIADGKYAGYIIENGRIRGNNKKLTKIDIPDGVTGIEDNAFEGYKSLIEVTIPDSVTYIGDSAFNGCSKLTKIVIPEGVKNINMFTFNECKNLVEVILPDTIQWIGLYAFSECTKLAKINLPDSIRTIYSSAFQGCASLTQITIPEGIDEINGSTFDGCKKLESIVIPDTVTEIGADAFSECEKLTKVHIPDDVHSIGRRVFSGCVRLEQVNIPADISVIEDGMFNGCKKLKSITIPAGVTSIGEDAFSNCESLTEIIIPEGVESIGDDAFRACKRIKRLKIPSTVKEIGVRAFYQCAGLTEVSIPEGIDKIPAAAFSECTGLKSITIPDGVISIDDYAFDGCSALMHIDLPVSLEKIGDNAFNGCKTLTDIEIPDAVTSIGDFAFDDCDALRSVSMPGQEVQMGSWAFPDEAEVSYRAGNGRVTKRKPGAQSNSLSRESSEAAMAAPKPSGRYTAVMPSDELYSHYGKLKREADKFRGMGVQFVQNNGEEFQALDILQILEHNGKTGTKVYRKLQEAMKGDNYALDQMALRFSQIFRVNESVFVSRHDDEGDINETLMDKKWKLSALRSFAWTLADLADREGKSIDDYEYDELVKLCDFIKDREWLNYQDGSWFDGLCGHPDIHVFYMPGRMIENGEAEEICDVLKNDPITSLDAFRDDLSQLKNAMIRLHNGLLKDRDRNVKLDTPASAVLQAWCVMAMAARIPFISEDGPMFFYHSYPTDALNTAPIPVGKQSATVKKAAPKLKKEEASSVMINAVNYEIVRGSDGKERVKIGEYPIGSPITWLVLEKNSRDLLLISEYGLDAKPYNSFLESGNSTNEWHDCSLRSWLNDGFYSEAFSTDERAMIVEDTHDTYKKTANGEEATDSVNDKVFLLSAREARKYFPKDRDLICKATAFAKDQGAEIESGPNQCSWWLRSPAVEMMGLAQWAASVRADGSCKGWGNSAGEVCVRPVIRVKADKISVGRESAPAAGSTATKRSTSKTKSTAKKQVSDVQESVNEVAATVAESADRPLTREEQEAVQNAQGILNNMQNQLGQTTSALEKHAETLRKQEEEKQKRIEESKKKGKSNKDETDMLVMLLNEEALGQLHREDSEFATMYAEDFGAYTESQLLQLRKKVMPAIHNADRVEEAKADMLSRSVEDRFTVSTANFFNVSTDWDLDHRGSLAIEKTALWYNASELSTVRELMDAHKEKTRQSVLSQLIGFNSAWGSFSTAKKDLQISIETSSDPIPEAHSLFHVEIQGGIHVSISLSNESLGFITIPIMNVFASCWKVSPESIWDAALNNKLNDSRGYAMNSRRDAEAGKAKALSVIKPQTTAQTMRDSGVSQQTRPSEQAPKAVTSSTKSDVNIKKIKELEERIATLQREHDSIKGLFGFVKKNKIKKEIQEIQQELYSLRNQ